MLKNYQEVLSQKQKLQKVKEKIQQGLLWRETKPDSDQHEKPKDEDSNKLENQASEQTELKESIPIVESKVANQKDQIIVKTYSKIVKNGMV